MFKSTIKTCFMMPFYAVRIGRCPGIYSTWSECEAQVKRFPKARHKKFDNREEAIAFINDPSQRPAIHKPCSSGRLPPRKTTNFKAKSNFTDSSSSGNRRTKLLSHDFSAHTFTSRNDLPTEPVVYTDGCCFGNGRINAVGGIGVYWGPSHPRNISEPLEVEKPTNQIAELRFLWRLSDVRNCDDLEEKVTSQDVNVKNQAACRALESAIDMGLHSIELRTDSSYTIKAVTEWMSKWEKNGWKTVANKDVLNQGELKLLSKLCTKISVNWVHVAGHQGIHGNEEADKLAKQGAEMSRR